MKILQVNPILPGSKNAGGAEKLFIDLSNYLNKNGHDVRLASNAHISKFSNMTNYHLTKVSNKIARKLLFDYVNPSALNEFTNILNVFRPDIVHFHSFYGISSYLAKHASKNYKTMVTAHDFWPICYWSTMMKDDKPCSQCTGSKEPFLSVNSYLHSLHKSINKSNLRNCKLVAPSKYMAEQLTNIGGFSNVITIHNGLPKVHQLTNYKDTIIWVGRVSKEKGLQNILPSITKLLSNTNWNFFVIGHGPLKLDLEQKYKNIKFLGFQDPHEYYKNSSILVFSSIWPENLPYTLLESMSYGLAVIAPNKGGIKEIITNKSDGLLYNDIKEFEEKLFFLMKNKNKIKYLGSNAQVKIAQKYNAINTYKEYENVYMKLLPS